MAKQCDVILLLLFFSSWCVSAYIPNDDISIIRQRVLDFMLLPTGKNLSSLIQNALNFTERLNSSCYWPDVDYHDTRMAH
jgi:hypothetical protein